MVEKLVPKKKYDIIALIDSKNLLRSINDYI